MSKSDRKLNVYVDLTSRFFPVSGPSTVSGSTLLRMNQVSYGENVWNWRWLISHGFSAVTNMSGTKYLINRQPSSAVVTNIITKARRSAVGMHSLDLDMFHACENTVGPAGIIGESVGRLSESFVANYTKKSRELQSLVTFGEIGETLRFLKRPAQSIRRGVDTLFNGYRTTMKKFRRSALHKANRRAKVVDKPSELLHALTDTWLEWAFAMRPLMSDADDAAKALAKIANTDPYTFIMVGGRGAAERSAVTAIGSWGFPSLTIGTSASFTQVWKCGHKQVGAIHSTCFSYPTPLTALGLTVEEFIPSLYELIPFSFLVDYFVNVGECLRVWSYQNMHLSWCCRTQKLETVVKPAEMRTLNGVVGNDLWSVNAQRSSFGTSVVTRSLIEGAGLAPDIKFTIPDLGTKWINIAALASGYAGVGSDVRRTLRV